MITSLKNKEDLKDLKELAELQSKAKQVSLVAKLGKQGFHYDIRKLIESKTKAVTDTGRKSSGEIESTAKQVSNWMNQMFM